MCRVENKWRFTHTGGIWAINNYTHPPFFQWLPQCTMHNHHHHGLGPSPMYWQRLWTAFGPHKGCSVTSEPCSNWSTQDERRVISLRRLACSGSLAVGKRLREMVFNRYYYLFFLPIKHSDNRRYGVPQPIALLWEGNNESLWLVTSPL